MKTIKWMCLAFICNVFFSPAQASDGTITLIHMGDIHGHLVPRPNMRDNESTTEYKVGGLAYLYSAIKKIRATHRNTLLINTGDTIQGSAEALFSRGQIIIDILNKFEIDAFAPGNWDFLYGTERFIELFSGNNPKANWNALAANLYYVTLYEYPLTPYPQKAGQRVLPSHVIKKMGGLNIAIVGLTAERGPQSVSPFLMDGFYLSPGEEELEEAISLLRKNHDVDLIVLISERGLAANLDIAERIPGVDIILSSDMHEETREVLQTKSGTLIIEEGQDGTMLGEITLTVTDKKISSWKWKPHFINTRDYEPDSEIQAMIEIARRPFIKGPGFVAHVNPVNAAVLRTPIDTVIGHTKIALHRSNFSDAVSMPAVVEGSSHNFLSDAFRLACNADVGVIRGFRYGTHIAPGPIRLEDIYHYIPIGPQIACGKVSGDHLYLAIEKSADDVFSGWVAHWGGGWLQGSSGITYTLDPGNEYRVRVSNMRINGELLDATRMYTVAGYWYLDNSHKINGMVAQEVKVLKDKYGGIVDATEVVAYYLQSLPSKTVDRQTNRVHLLKPLPQSIRDNKEIQPLRGVPRPDY